MNEQDLINRMKVLRDQERDPRIRKQYRDAMRTLQRQMEDI